MPTLTRDAFDQAVAYAMSYTVSHELWINISATSQDGQR
jgi:hypothetical protein